MRMTCLMLRAARCASGTIAAGALVCIAAFPVSPAPQRDEWRTRENLVRRLSGEWYKIQLLNRELANISDVLQDVRDIELFPPDLTGLTDKALVGLDKRLDLEEKKAKSARDDIARLKPELADAIGILSELVSGKPVKEMFDVLEKGDLERINEMLRIKHNLDTLWLRVDSLLSLLTQTVGISAKNTPAGTDQEFIAILKANLGLQSERYYAKLGAIKDTLAARAGTEQVREMYLVEIQRLRECLAKKLYHVAVRKADDVRKRYQSRHALDDVMMLEARALFNMGTYSLALQRLQQVPDNRIHGEAKFFYTVQCLYALGRTDEVWRWARGFDFGKLSKSNRNFLLWIALESALAQGETDTLIYLASRSDQQAPFMPHVLHTLARSFVAKGDLTTALSVVDRALRRTPGSDEERTVQEQLQMMAAHLNYELDRPEKALSMYVELMKKPEFFEEALLGITWSYIRLEAFDKAEASLRTLINQSPHSPKAVEAILLMSRRLVNKAQFEWKRRLHIEREGLRLESALSELLRRREKVRDSTGRRALDETVIRTRAMLEGLGKQPRVHPDTIAALFTKAEAVCGLVTRYYETGSFREAAFTAQREKLLHGLDSLLLAMKVPERISGSSAIARMNENTAKIKASVAQSHVLRTEILLNHYRWEREYLDWTKQKLNTQSQELASQLRRAGGSAQRARLESQRVPLKSAMDSLVLEGATRTSRWNRLLVSRITALLASPLTSDDAAYLYYHLGELHYTSENERFRGKYARYESETARYDSLMTLFRSGKRLDMPEQPVRPQLDHAGSIGRFRTVLQRYPRSASTPAAQYSLAWCFSDMGRYDSALWHMGVVGNKYPDSKYAPQAWMYIGEHAFDNGQLDKAVEAYQTVMKYPESDWFDEALYKFAWTHYRLSNPERAISSFLALVDLGKNSEHGKSFLEKESMDYIAISFSEADPTGQKGLSKASRFVDKFGDIDRGTQILHRLAEVYREQGRQDMAEKTYRSLIEKYPTYGRMPAIERGLLTVLEKRLPPAELNAKYVEFFEKYKRDGSWSAAQRDSSARALGDSLSQHSLYDAALGYHQEALQHNDTALYASAAKTYEKFIRAFPAAPSANECHYNLAEIKFSRGDYLSAAEEYIAVSKRYPGSKYRETAAWNAIVATQNLLRQEEKNPQ